MSFSTALVLAAVLLLLAGGAAILVRDLRARRRPQLDRDHRRASVDNYRVVKDHAKLVRRAELRHLDRHKP